MGNPTVTSSNTSDPVPATSAFSQVAGVLGGFCITVMVLALTPGVFTNETGKDLIISIFLFTAMVYITSATILANALNTYVSRSPATRVAIFNTGMFLFLTSNMLLAIGLLIITFQFPIVMSRIVSIVICIIALFPVLINFQWSQIVVTLRALTTRI